MTYAPFQKHYLSTPLGLPDLHMAIRGLAEDQAFETTIFDYYENPKLLVSIKLSWWGRLFYKMFPSHKESWKSTIEKYLKCLVPSKVEVEVVIK